MVRSFIFICLLAIASGTIFNVLRSKPLSWNWQPAIDDPASFSDFKVLDSYLNEPNSILVDARPQNLFKLGHLPGAINLPTEEAEKFLSPWLDKIDPKSFIIVYCSDPLCPLAETLAGLIRQKGTFRVALFSPGFLGWLDEGRPVES